jgi:hypothetical protein
MEGYVNRKCSVVKDGICYTGPVASVAKLSGYSESTLRGICSGWYDKQKVRAWYTDSNNCWESAFSFWNPIMAYVLGYFVADGCLRNKPYCSKGVSKSRWYFRVGSIDRDIVEFVSRFLQSKQSILVSTSYCPVNEFYTFELCNSKIASDLLNLGIVERKTYEDFDIDIPVAFESDFWRGFLDGDGSYIVQNKQKGKFVYLYVDAVFTSLNVKLRRRYEEFLSRNGIKFCSYEVLHKNGKIPVHFVRVLRKSSVEGLLNVLDVDVKFMCSRKRSMISKVYGGRVFCRS